MLDTSLIVDIATIQVDWLSVKRRLYNGTFPGPTIRIKANDVLHLKLVSSDQQKAADKMLPVLKTVSS